MNLTQKISQMTPKGADLEATDLIEVSTIVGGSYVTKSITGQELIDAIPAPSGFVPETRTLTINGVTQDLSADRTFTIATGLTVGTTPIASGTIGRVLFQGTGNVLQQSSSLFWDSTNERLGIGTSSPNYILTGLYSTSGQNGIRLNGSNASAQTQVLLENNLSTGLILGVTGSSIGAYGATIANQGFIYSTSAITLMSDGSIIKFASGGNTERMRLASTGNVLINTTTDAGFRLDVNGTARVQDNLTVSKNQNLGTTINITNTTSGNLAGPTLIVTSDASAGNYQFGKYSTTTTPYKIIASKDGFVYNSTTGGDIAILNDFATGKIKFAAGGSSTAQMTIDSTGNVLINTTTDAGFRLDVNGTARVSGNMFVNSGSSTSVGLSIGDSTTASFLSYFSGGMYFKVTNANAMVLTAGTNGGLIIGASGSQNTASARLQVDSTTQGFLPPRMTTTQRNAIASPAAGLVVYDNTDNKHYGYNGTTWNAFY